MSNWPVGARKPTKASSEIPTPPNVTYIPTARYQELLQAEEDLKWCQFELQSAESRVEDLLEELRRIRG